MKNLSYPEELTVLVGQRLKSLSRGDLLIDGEPNTDDLGPLELVFDSNATLQIRLADDGESIEFQLSTSRPFELTGQGGAWPRVGLSKESRYEPLLGKELISLEAIYFGSSPRTEHPELLAGLSFGFPSGRSLAYYNGGDFAKIYVNEMPPALAKPFYLRFVRLLASTQEFK